MAGGVRGPESASYAATPRIPPGAIARLTDELWWRRKLRVVHGRLFEAGAINVNLVHRFAGRYVSDATLARHQQQRRRNAKILATLIAENEIGESFELSELIARSLANPANRRAELMVRIYGFDQLAIKLGHEAVLVTVTCPSRMHSHLGEDGARNPRYDPATTPRDAQAYLTRLWSRIRAKWQRDGLRPYGFRIAEAHHDGTPHWHILLFCEAKQKAQMIEAVRHHAMADSPNESGAVEHRFSVENIDRTKGSATGYVAKYISKNIDGFGLKDEDGMAPAATLAQRSAAWSSTWGIRQFQQIGGPPVSLWREFRRAPGLATTSGLIGQLSKAADEAHWDEFVMLLGGPQVERKLIPVQLEKYQETRPGRYGDPLGLRIAGVKLGNVVFSTRFHTWTIKQKLESRNCTRSLAESSEACLPEGQIFPAATILPSWSSVNNCTLRSSNKI